MSGIAEQPTAPVACGNVHGAPALETYCATFGIAPEHVPLAQEVFTRIYDLSVASVVAEAERGRAPGFQKYVARLLDREIELPPSASLREGENYLSAATREIRRELTTLAPMMAAKSFERLEASLADHPFWPPVGNETVKVLIMLLLRGLEANTSPGFSAYAAGLGLDKLATQLLLGTLETVLFPWPQQDIASTNKNEMYQAGRLAELLKPTMTSAAFEEVEAGLHAYATGAPLHEFALGSAMRAQIPPSPVAPGTFEHDPLLTAGRFCSQPFEYAQINPDGEVYLCCPVMLNASIGNLRHFDLMDVWNSPTAQSVRASVLDGSFRYCDGNRCGLIAKGGLPLASTVAEAKYRRAIDEGRTIVPEGPGTINMAYDRTCNLTCPSCRNEKIVLKGFKFRIAERIHAQVERQAQRSVDHLIITGSGDPFVSRLFLDFLRTFRPESRPSLRIHLSTNGLLLTPEMWSSICHEAIDWIDVSIDGASQATYSLNRGGNFERLVENLHFIGGLLREQQIESFWIHFVVQANNFREMPAFAELGRAVGASRICFKELQDWGTYTPGDFKRRAVTHPEHPEHAEFLTVIEDPRLTWPEVWLFDMDQPEWI